MATATKVAAWLEVPPILGYVFSALPLLTPPPPRSARHPYSWRNDMLDPSHVFIVWISSGGGKPSLLDRCTNLLAV